MKKIIKKIDKNSELIEYSQTLVAIKQRIHESQIKAILSVNTELLLDSDLAQQSFKDPYICDFLTLHEKYMERDLEQGLIDNVQKLLLEMGKGFALVGRQYHIVVGPKDYYIDLLFYHIELRCYVVVELKAREFAHTDAGQISFYLAAIDNNLKNSQDNPTIGLILCKNKDHYTAEYALQNINAPVGIASYQIDIMNKLPKELKSKLPTIAELENELEKQDIMTKLTNKK